MASMKKVLNKTEFVVFIFVVSNAVINVLINYLIDVQLPKSSSI